MSSEIDDKEIIKKYLQGDEKSLEVLIKKYLNPIYGFIFKNVGNTAAAEDITQEVFIKIWKNLKKFDQKKDFKPWIFQIAKNASIDYLRKKKNISYALPENLKEKSEDIINTLSDKKEVKEIIKNLPEKEVKLINLRFKDGLGFREISDILKEPIDTIKSRYRRIIIKIRKKAPK